MKTMVQESFDCLFELSQHKEKQKKKQDKVDFAFGFLVFFFSFLLYLFPVFCFFFMLFFDEQNKKRQTKKPYSIGAKTKKSKGKKLFLIEMNGNSVSWSPEKTKNDVQLWQKLKSTVERHFVGVKLNENSIIVYNEDNNNEDDDISQFLSCQLRLNTIASYCSRLRSSSDNSTMKFSIKMVNSIINDADDSDVKLVRIMSGHENKYECNGILYFDENENDENENYDSIIEYVNKIYDITVDKTVTNENGNVKEYEFDYSALPYVIRKIERDDYKHIQSGTDDVNVDMDDMVEVECDDFNECYDSDDSTNGRECVLLIEIKQYILFTMNNNSFVWIPQNANSKNENIDWKSEYKRARDLVCNHFQVESSYDIQFEYKSGNDSAFVHSENDFAKIWNNCKLAQHKSTSGGYVEIAVTTAQNTSVVGEVFVFLPPFLVFFF